MLHRRSLLRPRISIFGEFSYIFTHRTYRFELSKTLRIGKELLHLSRPRVVQPHCAVHKLHSIGFARLQNLIQLRHIQSRRLLQKHMLLLLRRQHCPLQVQARRQRHVHGVNIGVVQHRLVAAVNLSRGRESVGGGESRGLLQRTAADGVQSGIGSQRYRPRYLARYVGAAQNPELDQRFGHVVWESQRAFGLRTVSCSVKGGSGVCFEDKAARR